jgi:hypothetical protein
MNPMRSIDNSNKRPLSSIENSVGLQPKPTGKLSSLSRQWSSTNQPRPHEQQQKNLPSSSQPVPQSSSQPTWQLDEDDWPPTQAEPPAKKSKPDHDQDQPAALNQKTKSAIRYPPPRPNQGASTASGNLNKTASESALPWDIKNTNKNNSTKSTAFNQLPGFGKQNTDGPAKTHLNNPNMSIAAKVKHELPLLSFSFLPSFLKMNDVSQ